MKHAIAKVKLNSISRNERNIFTEEEDLDQIKCIAESIKKIGLESPIVVYQCGGTSSSPEYKILSGHKRFAALKLAGYKGTDEIPCVINDAPKDAQDEREILLQNNLSRKKPEELEKQVTEANNIWNIMEPARRQELINEYRRKFMAANKGCSDKYVRDNFRARLEYIKEQTGLEVSNRTVTSIINKSLNKVNEGFPLPAKKVKQLEFKDVYSRIKSLKGIIDVYCGGDQVTAKEKRMLNAVKASLVDVITDIEEA